jgi:3'-phosphoadenosine 5'-phosphosulfate (PAPS) 3'-phosphatase
MKLSPDDLLALQQTAIAAATEAGHLIAERARQSKTVRHKNTGDSLAAQVVTEVDLLSEKTILKWLQPSCEQYQLALLTEETTDNRERLQKDYFWCVDPLDGTLAFIESTSGYAVSIALVSRSGIPLIGVVYEPLTGNLYSAIQGQGVMRNAQPWSPISSASFQGRRLTVLCDRGLKRRKDYTEIIKALESCRESLGLDEIEMIDKGAGAVMNACWVLEHQPACYFKLPKPDAGGGSLWDFAASAAIYNELGAAACDFYGEALELNRKESTFMNHRGVIFASHQALKDKIQQYMLELI